MNVPLILTFTRLIISPFVPAVLLVFLLPQATVMIHLFLVTLFAIMVLTDFFDGYLARRLNQETLLGKILDPIADKTLVLSTGIVLVYLDKIFWLWAIIIMSREVLVMGLRELAVTYGFSLPVSRAGKYKSVLQYIYFMVVIGVQEPGLLSTVLGCCTSLVTLVSGYQYLRDFMIWYYRRA